MLLPWPARQAVVDLSYYNVVIILAGNPNRIHGPDWRPFSLFVCLPPVSFGVELVGGLCCPDDTGGKILLIVRRGCVK